MNLYDRVEDVNVVLLRNHEFLRDLEPSLAVFDCIPHSFISFISIAQVLHLRTHLGQLALRQLTPPQLLHDDHLWLLARL